MSTDLLPIPLPNKTREFVVYVLVSTHSDRIDSIDVACDRLQKGKVILMGSLSCWIIFTLPLGFIQPPATSCMLYKNHTYLLNIPASDQTRTKRSALLGERLLPGAPGVDRPGDALKILHDGIRENIQKRTPHLSKRQAPNREAGTAQHASDALDLDELSKMNRPADILEYKKFLKVRTFYWSHYSCVSTLIHDDTADFQYETIYYGVDVSLEPFCFYYTI